MKKKRFWKNAGLVALSTVMVGGAALAFTACGGNTGSDYQLEVYVFCGDADAMTNETICNNWAQRYSQEHADELGGNTVTVKFTANPSKGDYFDDIGGQISSGGSTGNYPDIIYVSPSQVLTYAGNGTILDLTDYITASESAVSQVNGIWKDSLSFYATKGSSLLMSNVGEIGYNDETNTFYDASTQSGTEASIYGLPKDYSNFGLGYNRNYFTDVMKAAYTTLTSSVSRTVTSRIYKQSNAVAGVTHTGEESGAITYAVSGDYINPYTGEEMTATEGQIAPFINIGVPTAYKPFNFYQYATYADAIAGGDPLALSTRDWTGGEGYIITVPGFPGETFSLVDDEGTELYDNSVNEDAVYDAESANLVLTWAEYGALNWACTYMLNSFAWDSSNGVKNETNIQAALDADTFSTDLFNNWTSGQGGVYAGGGSGADTDIAAFNNVYGGEQYEQSTDDVMGGNMYVLPWLFSNDATFIDSSYTKSLNETRNGKPIASASGSTWSWASGTSDSDVYSRVGNATENVSKTNLDGTERTAKVQYGINSENFIETYGAFQEYIATWNAHVGQAGDVASSSSDKSVNGQAVFVMGASLFYGVGSWDVSEYQEVDRDTLDLGIMPTAVSDKLALYSEVRSPYYLDSSTSPLVVTYANANNTKGTGDGAGTATVDADGKYSGDYAQLPDPSTVISTNKIFAQADILKNQVLRQDKWAGRMDSVGYAVNGHLADEGQPDWLAAAAVDLVMELTVGEQAQITLTYGGAQIPNVMEQCEEYLNYNVEGYENGAFADMITPEDEEWDEYYDLALEMAAASRAGNTGTVADYLNGKQIGGEDVRYDTQYENVPLSEFTEATSVQTKIAYAMRVLRMINYTRAERDILIRMQTGMNAVRDQTLYTPGTTWMSTLNATASPNNFLAYRNQASFDSDSGEIYLPYMIAYSTAVFGQSGRTIYTPAVYAVATALRSQNYLSAGQ